MSNKINTAKMTKLQVIGLWVLVAGSILFWGGVYIGTQATLASQSEQATIKSQAVEEYKASLKANQ